MTSLNPLIQSNINDDLSELADHTNSPMTQQQMVDLAFVIFARQSILQQDLRLWNRCPAADCTWLNMMLHLREAQSDLSTIPTSGDIFHQQAPFQANQVQQMAELVHQRMVDEQIAMHAAFNMQHQAPPGIPPAPAYNMQHQVPHGYSPPPAHSDAIALEMANSLQRREEDRAANAAVMTQMQTMMATMMAGHQNRYNRNRNPARSSAGRTGRGNTNTARTGQLSNRKYCHSHGSCAHASNECNTPAPGHQTAATFANMMGGSTTRCYWIPPS